jgi:hypothetical protein
MRVVRNTGYIKRRQRIARAMILIGVVALTSSIVITFRWPTFLLPAYAVLIVGFFGFNVGMQQLAKWNSRPDKVLDAKLRRLNDRYTLIHYSDALHGRPEHVLVYPGGLLVITTRQVQGTVTVKNNRWSRPGGRIWSLIGMSGPQLGNPTLESARDQEALKVALRGRDLPGEDLVDGLIAFLSPKVQLEVVSSDLTTVTADEILGAVRDLGSENALISKERDDIIAALAEGPNVEGPVSLSSREPGTRRARAA